MSSCRPTHNNNALPSKTPSSTLTRRRRHALMKRGGQKRTTSHSLTIRNGFLENILKAVTPKDAKEIQKEKEMKRVKLIEQSPKGCMKSAYQLLANTVIDGEELVLAYDATRDGWTASAFHERVDGKGPTLIFGKTAKNARFAAYNPLGFLNGDASGMEILPNVGSPAIFDFGAQGPSFGPDGLRIPLGNAPANGSSYAGIGEATTSYGSSKKCISRLGSHYAGRSDGVTSVFAKGEKNETNLKELIALVSPSMERDGLYVS
ncbi:unnamed protein product [Bathycoccus prasinos]